MAEKRRKLWNPFRTSENQARGRIAVRIRAVDETHPAFPKPNNRKETNARPSPAPSTAVSPTVAIHHGDHGTYEPAGTTIEQNSQQQTFKQTVVRKLRIRKTEFAETMARMKRFQRFKPAIVCHGNPIQWNGVIETAIFEGHSRKSNLQHGDLMLQQELRHDGMIWSENIILIHIHSNLSSGSYTNHLAMGRYRSNSNART